MTLRPVYSIQIMALAPALPNNTVVVPDNSRIIVRDVDIRHESAGASDGIYIENAAGGILWLVEPSTTDAVGNAQWRGRQVFNPGESINVHVIAGTWSVQMSGYELTLT